jgi:hypothetical protein
VKSIVMAERSVELSRVTVSLFVAGVIAVMLNTEATHPTFRI